MTTEQNKSPPPPARQNLLAHFGEWSETGDRQFYFEQLVDRWMRCGYSLQELPLLVTATPEQFAAAIAKARGQA